MDLRLSGKRALITGSSSGIGAAVAFLASPRSDFTTGALLRIDGGNTRGR